ncbi:MAG: HindVP family restriction endonuclease [Prevotellaceae bacterium]|nr:HindVP family restriction endonuclease [Prevotellaceae bacterium]
MERERGMHFKLSQGSKKYLSSVKKLFSSRTLGNSGFSSNFALIKDKVMANKKIKKPGLFGIKHSNRDFEQKDAWGKNQFNSSFPVALASYMGHKNIDNAYLTLDKKQQVRCGKVSTHKLFGIAPDSDDLFYSFESVYTPYERFVIGELPRVDLVTQKRSDGVALKGMEIKLTALPDNSTCNLSDDLFGTEIVTRPPTIIYLACSIASLYQKSHTSLRQYFDVKFDKLRDWANPEIVLPHIKDMIDSLDKILSENNSRQVPVVMQPVWKTEGKSPRLAENCLDVFIWSNFAFVELIVRELRNQQISKITRQARTLVWLFKMLYDFSKTGQFYPKQIIDDYSYNTLNDKAFAVSGIVTHSFMQSPELTTPRIKRNEIKNIILGGGQNLLSPERRFDAIIFNTPELFD